MKTTMTAAMATTGTRPNAVSNCSLVGNGYNYKTAREQHPGTRANRMTAEPQNNGEMRRRRHTEWKKGSRDVVDVSWATGEFFFLFLFHFHFTNNLLGTNPTYGEEGRQKGHNDKKERTKGQQRDNKGHLAPSTPNHAHEQLLAAWKQRAATKGTRAGCNWEGTTMGMTTAQRKHPAHHHEGTMRTPKRQRKTGR